MAVTSDIGIETAPSRRGMLGLGKFAAAGLSVAAVAAATTAANAATSYTDSDIFNLALNLEYIGAEFYLRAVSGEGIAAYNPSLVTGIGTHGTVTVPAGSTLVPFANPAVAYFAIQLANDEIAHLEFFRDVIGSGAISQPSIDFTAFTPVAQAAGLIGAGETFNPFASEINFLIGAYLLEDTCVTALTGAAQAVLSPTNLSYAAGLLGVEAQQAGAIRGFLSQFGQDAATDAISTLRAKLSTVGDQGTGDENNAFNISNGDGQAQAFRRTPSQVLAIAYGAAGVSKGAFFPAGVNYSNPAFASS